MAPKPRSLHFHADAIEASEAEPDDAPELQALFEESHEFFELTTGFPAGPAEVQSLFTSLPAGKTYRDKHVIALRSHEEGLVAVVDAIRDYPDAGSWWMSLLLLKPSVRGRGMGTVVFHAFMDWAAAHGARRIWLCVKAQDEAAARF